MGNSDSKLNSKIKIIDGQIMRGIYDGDNLVLELYGINNENINKKMECNICQCEYKIQDLFVMCNKFPCEGFSCISCIKKVLNTNIERGNVVSLESMKCLFCKRNTDQKFLSEIYDNYKLLFSFYLRYRNMEKTQIGYCKCGKIQKVKINNNCNHNEDINIDVNGENAGRIFICDICNFNIIKNKQICRQCNNYIEKTGGCNHMICRCGYQWCWKCKTQWGISKCTSYRCENDYKFSMVGLFFGGINSNINLQHFVPIIKYNKDGYDKKGYDINGFNKNGYNKDGYDCFGFDIDGKNKFKLSINDYNDDYYDVNGLDFFGYDKNGYDKNGYDYDGYDNDGYDKKGYDRDGYNKKGYNREGYDRYGNNPRRITKFLCLCTISILIVSSVHYSVHNIFHNIFHKKHSDI